MGNTLVKISFKNRRNILLQGRLHLPLGPIYAFALYAPCFTCTKDIKAARNICQSLSERGIAALRLDFAGLGDSEGAFHETNFTSNVEDLQDAAAYLREQYQAPEILIGHSLGGTAALIAATKIPGIKAISTINSPCDPRHVARHFQDAQEEIIQVGEAQIQVNGQHLTVKKHFLDDLKSYDMEAVFKKLTAALLVFHAPHDDIVHIKNAGQIFSMAQHPKSFISLDSADHLILNPDDARYIAASIAAWASRYIRFDCTPDDRKAPLGQVIVSETNEGLYTQRVYIGQHVLRADEPASMPGGLDLGPGPYDYLLAGLGACTSMTIRMYANHKKLNLDKVTVYLHHKKIHAKDCQNCEEKAEKIDVIEREIVIEGDLSTQEREGIIRIADKCPVHKTLEGRVKVISTEKAKDKDDEPNL